MHTKTLQRKQTTNLSQMGGFSLPMLVGAVKSQYSVRNGKLVSNIGRDINLNKIVMTDVTAIVSSFKPAFNGTRLGFDVQFFSSGAGIIDALSLDFETSSMTPTLAELRAAVSSPINTYASGQQLNVVGYIWPDELVALTPGPATRSLNSAFQISSSKICFVSYTVDIASTLSLTSGQTGTVILEYADNSGMSTNLTTVQSSANGNTGTLTIGLNLTQTATASVSGVIPAGKYVRIRTVNTAGTPTFTYRAGQETLVG